MKILIVEDEKDLRETLEEFLLQQKYMVETANSYRTAIDKITIYDYDCILLDIMLPDGSGLEILSKLKALNKSENVIIISAKDSLDDKVRGLAMGADDYLAKPFHLAELNARIKAVFRRKNLGGRNSIELGNIVLDLDERVFMVDNNTPMPPALATALARPERDIPTPIPPCTIGVGATRLPILRAGQVGFICFRSSRKEWMVLKGRVFVISSETFFKVPSSCSKLAIFIYCSSWC